MEVSSLLKSRSSPGNSIVVGADDNAGKLLKDNSTLPCAKYNVNSLKVVQATAF
jgi:hypothetical protein